ncbi:Y-family DNA polymerase [Mycoplasmopsis iners]|uniref:Y-family DNA polymerase n=1 Tax=Mycoplasmopsis iners TaxID=76630 RepID=UPI00049756F7|nr:DNA polymerase IV [Mycoplasmopsis iners]
MFNKTIFHIDFDSYFVSAHRSVDPSLIGKPVAIGRNLKRSIASSISYELKNKGAKTGWPNYKIFEIEPKTIIVEPNFELYVSISNKIFDYLSKKYSRFIEIYSIDECWIDMTKLVVDTNPVKLAQKIQKEILNKFKIPITIGISYNKFLAKMATNLGKPFGIKFIDYFLMKDEIWPLDIEEFFGIGNNTIPKLRALNINKIGDLAKSDPYELRLYDIFKSRTKILVDEARGYGSDEIVIEHNHLKSIGTDLTFMSNDIDDYDHLLEILKSLTKKVCFKASNRDLVGNVIYINIRDIDRKWTGKQHKMPIYSNEFSYIWSKIRELFDKTWKGNVLRGIGVKLMNVKPVSIVGTQLPLFTKNGEAIIEKAESEQEKTVKQLIKKINSTNMQELVFTADKLEKKKHNNKIQTKFIDDDYVK